MSCPLFMAQRLGKRLLLCHNRSVLFVFHLKRVHMAKSVGLPNRLEGRLRNNNQGSKLY